MIILRTKSFATTGEALEKKVAKLMEKEGLTRAQALEVIKKRDQIAVDLNKTRNEINKISRGATESDRLYKKGLKDLLRINAIRDANLENIDAIRDQKRENSKIKFNAIDRHARRDSSGKDKIIKAKYLLRKGKNWVMKNPGKTVLGVGVTAGGAYGAKKLYDRRKEEESENNS